MAAVQVGHGHTFVDVFSYGDAVAQGAPVSFEQDYSNLAQGMFTTAVYLAGRNTDAAGTLTTSTIGALLELVMAPANGINLIEGQVVTQDHALIDSDTNATGEVEGETVALDYQITGADTDSVGLVDAVEMINYILVGADADGQHGIEWVSLAPTLTLGSSSSLSVNIMSAQTYTPVERRWSNVAQGYFVTDAALAAPGYVQQFNYVEGAPVSTFADVITAHDLVTVPVVLSAIIQQRNITTDAADINNSNQVEAVSTIFESLPLEGSDLNAGGEVKTASLDVVYPLEARDLSDGSPFLQSLTDDYSRDDKAVEMVSFVGRLFMSLDDLENWAVINAIYAPHERRWSNLAQGYFVTDALIAAHDLESTGAVRGNAVTLTPHLIERDLENTGEVQSVVLGVDVQLTADNAYGAGQVSEGVVDQPEGIVVTNI